MARTLEDELKEQTEMNKRDFEGLLFCVAWRLCTHLRPLIGLRVVSFHSAEIHLTVIAANSKETVTKETNANRVPADAHRGDSCPHICLRVVPAYTQHTRVCGQKEAEVSLPGKTPALKTASHQQQNDHPSPHSYTTNLPGLLVADHVSGRGLTSPHSH